MQLKRYQDMKDHLDNAAERKQIDDAMTELQERLEAWAPQEQELQIKETECEDELKVQRAKLDSLQDELDRIDRALENSVLQAGYLPQQGKP
jgi:chromosome segregation ATPase